MEVETLLELLYYVTIQFTTTCDYLSFAIVFLIFTTIHHLFKFVIIFMTMVKLQNYTSFHID
jgi:hypothetical protein